MKRSSALSWDATAGDAFGNAHGIAKGMPPGVEPRANLRPFGTVPLGSSSAPLRCPRRGEVWLLAAEEVAEDCAGEIGRNWSKRLGGDVFPDGRQAVIVVSDDIFNSGPSGVILALPLTIHSYRLRMHVALPTAQSGLECVTYAQCEHLASLPVAALDRACGCAAAEELAEVEFRLKALLGMRL